MLLLSLYPIVYARCTIYIEPRRGVSTVRRRSERSLTLRHPGRLETELPMKTYVAHINEKAILLFRSEDDDQARDLIEDEDGSIRSDLKVLDGADGKPLWDGRSAIEVREATPAQHEEWERSRDQAISDGEIDLDAGNDPDEWNVYLVSIPKGRKRST